MGKKEKSEKKEENNASEPPERNFGFVLPSCSIFFFTSLCEHIDGVRSEYLGVRYFRFDFLNFFSLFFVPPSASA